MILKNLISELLINLTLIGHLLVIAFLGILIASKNGWKQGNKIMDYLNKNALLFAFIISLIAVFGSLFYSEIMGYEPCKLCWIQRIFMYPLPLILGISLWHNKDISVKKYVIPMGIIGAFIAAYHYSGQVLEKITTCGALSEGIPCTIRYTFGYGYITIPMMALTAFLIVAVLMWAWKKNSKKEIIYPN